MASVNFTPTPVSPPAPTPAYGYLILAVIPLVSVFGNGLVILAVLRDKKLKVSITNRYTAALALSDLIVGLVPMPLAVYVKVNGDHWGLGVAFCRFYVACDVASSTASILHLALISADRYLAIMWPHEYQRYTKRAKVSFPIALVWMISATISIPVFMGKSILNTETCWLENPEYMIYSSLLSFYIPAGVMTLMYVKIFRKLNRLKSIRSMLRASGAVCGSGDTGAPFSLPLVVVQEVSYPRPTASSNHNNNVDKPSATVFNNSHTSQTSILPRTEENERKHHSLRKPDFDPAQKLNNSSSANNISSQTCPLSTAVATATRRMVYESKATLAVPEDYSESSQAANDCLEDRSRKLADEESVSHKTEERIPLNMDRLRLPSRRLLRVPSHHGDDRDETRERLLAKNDLDERRRQFKRSVSTMVRRPCVVATRRLSFWFTSPPQATSQEFSFDTSVPNSTSSLDLDQGKSAAGGRRNMNSSTSENVQVDAFDSKAWADEMIREQRLIKRRLSGERPCAAVVQMEEDKATTYAVPVTVAARTGGTLRKLASRFTAVLQRKTDKQVLAKEKRATKMVAMILGVFIICWLPFFTFNIIRGLCLSITNSACDWLPAELFFLTTWLGYANSGLNPILYGLVNEQFRATYKRILRCPADSRRDSWSGPRVNTA